MCLVDMLMFSMRRHLFNIFGTSLQCHSFLTVKAKAVTLSFLFMQSRHDVAQAKFILLFFWGGFSVCVLFTLRERKKRQREAGEGMTV